MGIPRIFKKVGISALVSKKFTPLSREEKTLLMDLLCLLILAKDGPDWCYNIYKKLKKIELPRALNRKKKKPFKLWLSTVGRALDRLESQKLIKKEEKIRKLEKGHPKRIYHLNFHGLLYLLEFYKESWAHIDDIAIKHLDKLPLIFGEWEYFGEKGVKGKVIEAMKNFCITYVPYKFAGRGRLERTDEPLLIELMTHSTLYFDLGFITRPPLNKASEQIRHRIFEREKKKALEWVKIWFGNQKLKLYLNEELDKYERGHEEGLRNIKILREYIQSLERNSR